MRALLGLAVMSVACAAAATSPPAPSMLAEATVLKKEMIVTANPLASQAGADVLARGGTAADAMVGAQSVLGLVEPQSSGLGGGAFVVYYDAATGKTTTFDAREKAPAAATEARFTGRTFTEAWQSGLSVGVPGTPRMMEVVHQRYGKKQWGKLLQPAIRLASHGFEMTGRTADQVNGLLASNPSCIDRLFFRDPVAFAYFAQSDGASCMAKPAGTIMHNPDYAKTLRAMRRHGADAFYTGRIAESIVAAVRNDPAIAGDMTLADLADYRVIERHRPARLRLVRFLACSKTSDWAPIRWRSKRCICSLRLAGWRLPIVACMWVTPTSSRCRPRGCSTRPTCVNGPG